MRDTISKIVAGVALVAIGAGIGHYGLPARLAAPAGPFITVKNGERQFSFPTFWEAWDQLHEKFNGDLKDEKLYYGAVEGMVHAAGDPYTVFSTPEDTKQFEEALSGSFSGVGIEIGVHNGVITVIAPLQGYPAEKAGVRAGDAIVAIGKKPITQDTALDDVVQQIRGPKGTTVTLTVIHKDSREAADITITRDTIRVESVKLDVADGLAHITITNFENDTSSAFGSVVRQIHRQGVRGVILDMRGNPGGLLQAAIDVASHFVPAGSVVVTEKGKESHEYRAKGSHQLQAIPVAVLVDEGSASASEIVAGALRDIRHAPIIGQKTFGKGSVQEFLKLEDGASLRVTVAKWFTPSGQSIHEQGIAPTIEVSRDPEKTDDAQLNRARETLKGLLK